MNWLLPRHTPSWCSANVGVTVHSQSWGHEGIDIGHPLELTCLRLSPDAGGRGLPRSGLSFLGVPPCKGHPRLRSPSFKAPCAAVRPEGPKAPHGDHLVPWALCLEMWGACPLGPLPPTGKWGW